MRVRNSKSEMQSEITSKALKNHLASRKIGDCRRPKLNASMERNIERILCESEKLGWNHNEFVGSVLEVLIILQQRNKVDLQRTPDLTPPVEAA
jgi:hypothetical protein